MKDIFIDKLTIPIVLFLCFKKYTYKTVWYFESASLILLEILRISSVIGIITKDIRKVTYNVGEIKDSSGKSLYDEIYRDITNICSRIKEERIDQNPLLALMNSTWDRKILSFHFEKLVEQYIPGEPPVECLRIGLVNWMACHRLQLDKSDYIILIRRKQWFSYISLYAAAHGIKLYGYPNFNYRFLFEGSKKLLSFSMMLLNTLDMIKQDFLRNRIHPNDSNKTDGMRKHNPGPNGFRISICHSGSKISFDPSDRSDFFWMNGVEIPFSKVLLFNCVGNQIIDEETRGLADQKQIKILGDGPGLTKWVSTPLRIKIMIRMVLIIMINIVRCLCQGRWTSSYYIKQLIILSSDYSYWFDFYFNQKIIANVSQINATTTGQVLAINALNGISFCYQHSASNYFPTTFISAGENVQFVFSNYFQRLWEKIDAPVEQYIETGFIYDAAIRKVQSSSRIPDTRKRLFENGAKFIICYFDENSIDRWDMPVPHEQAAKDYEFLLNWLIEDPCLGLVFKPKRPVDLFQRLSTLSELIESAIKTKRCTFIRNNTKVDHMYPTEAALMSDLCIGRLNGVTAALEARVAGVPTILIDSDNIYNHPFYEWGYDRVVFNDWKKIRRAIEKYRAFRCSDSDFGDWSPIWDQLDPYQDGQASQKMGSFIRWAVEALENGDSQATALSVARHKFKKRWNNSLRQ